MQDTGHLGHTRPPPIFYQKIGFDISCNLHELTVLGFNDMSTLVGHFVSSPREREKRDRRDSRGDEREGQGRKRNRNEREKTEIKTFPSTLTCSLPNC